MNTIEIEMCIAVPGCGHIIDGINPATGRTRIYGRTLEDVQVEAPGAVSMPLEQFCADKAARQDTPITWDEITAEQYDYWLECLPPAAWENGAFLVGEPSDHHAQSGRPRYQACKAWGGKHYASNRPLTVKEFKAIPQVQKAQVVV